MFFLRYYKSIFLTNLHVGLKTPHIAAIIQMPIFSQLIQTLKKNRLKYWFDLRRAALFKGRFHAFPVHEFLGTHPMCWAR